MIGQQFETVQLKCPHCGYVIGEQAFFQQFETKAAYWLQGEVAPNSTPAFDVWKCKPFPHLTFQVKYAIAHYFDNIRTHNLQITWTWKVKHPNETIPDFFIFFGLDTDERESVFLFSHDEFFRKSCVTKEGHAYCRVSAKLRSAHKNYTPKIWRYHVANPERNLIMAIKNKILHLPSGRY